MPDINSVVPHELPSTRKLIHSTILAAVIATVLLATVILPAEYGVDPTGIGRVLGLTEMGEIRVSLAEEATRQESSEVLAEPSAVAPTHAVAAAVDPVPVVPATQAVVAVNNSHETRVTLRPGEGKEIKLVMREGARVKYSWWTDRGAVNFDRHADSVNPRRQYYGYAKGTAVPADKGEMVAAFDGSHGWFWRNRTNQDVNLTLETDGEYAELKELK